jgi:hypothetical protein
MTIDELAGAKNAAATTVVGGQTEARRGNETVLQTSAPTVGHHSR